MQKDRVTNLIHLHFIVFIYGFTAILGKLISIDAMPLVWIRMGLATAFIGLYLWVRKVRVAMPVKDVPWLIGAGLVVALHWITFFWAIKVSTVSVALAMMSTGAFFTALMEPFWFRRKLIVYEVLLGLLVIFGLYMIFRVESQYVQGMVIALVSAFLAAIFALINGKLVRAHRPSVISFYELGVGALFLTVLLGLQGKLVSSALSVSLEDLGYLIILALLCTAYAFIAAVRVMRVLTPYTVMLTTNMEPVYGILMAWFIFGSEERMDVWFYVGAALILLTILANGILKLRANRIKG